MAQHERDLDRQDQLKQSLKTAASLLDSVQIEKEQIILDKQQIEDKLSWMESQLEREEQAYRVIKRSIRPWVLMMRVKKLVRGGEEYKKEFVKNYRMREGRTVDMVVLLSHFAKQLRILSQIYCERMEYFFQQHAYTPMDPSGLGQSNFLEYKLAVHQMAQVYYGVETEVRSTSVC